MMKAYGQKKLIEYWYKENCDYCVNGCKECGHFGYTESDAESKDEIPLDAFDVEEIKTSQDKGQYMNKNKSKFKHLWKLHEEQKPRLSEDDGRQIYVGSPFLKSAKWKNHSKLKKSRRADESSWFDKVDKYKFVCIILSTNLRADADYEFMEEVYDYYMSKSTSELFGIVDSDSDTYDLYENIDRCHEWDWICDEIGTEDLKELSADILSADIINNKTNQY